MSAFQWTDLIVALGLVLVIEGLLYALFPGGIRRLVAEIPKLSDSMLRTFGVAALCSGVFIVWMMRG